MTLIQTLNEDLKQAYIRVTKLDGLVARDHEAGRDASARTIADRDAAVKALQTARDLVADFYERQSARK